MKDRRKNREEEKERKRLDNKWKRVEKMRVRKERRTGKEWKQ